MNWLSKFWLTGFGNRVGRWRSRGRLEKLPERASGGLGVKINSCCGEGASPPGSGMSDIKKPEQLDEEMIRSLALLLNETGLNEIEIEQKGIRVRVARGMPAAVAAPQVIAAAPAIAHAPVVEDLSKHPGMVASPMVGTAYRSAEPGAPPFVDVGSFVKEGQTLVIIEAMKTMNHIPAPHGGTVKTILVENGQPVEYGEPLMIIE
jgi:acetyl-CoA carboxylase biotin carboxyl carrier protein